MRGGTGRRGREGEIPIRQAQGRLTTNGFTGGLERGTPHRLPPKTPASASPPGERGKCGDVGGRREVEIPRGPSG